MKVYFDDVGWLYDEDTFLSYYQNVSFFRKQKIDRMIFLKDKALSLGVEILLSKALADAGINPGDCEMSTGPNGKPYISNYPKFHFNLSHSETKIMCAAGETEVGCDVEKIRMGNSELAQKFFCRPECELVLSKPEGIEREILFCRLWALKESFMKVTGLGMSLSPDSFEIYFDESGSAGINQNVTGDSFAFMEYQKGDGYCYALCWKK